MKKETTTAPTFAKSWQRDQYHREQAEAKRREDEDLKTQERRERNGRGRNEEAPYIFRSTHGAGQTSNAS